MYIYPYKMKHWKALFIRHMVAMAMATFSLHNFIFFFCLFFCRQFLAKNVSLCRILYTIYCTSKQNVKVLFKYFALFIPVY